jgi:hypothetical protein
MRDTSWALLSYDRPARREVSPLLPVRDSASLLGGCPRRTVQPLPPRFCYVVRCFVGNSEGNTTN